MTGRLRVHDPAIGVTRTLRPEHLWSWVQQHTHTQIGPLLVAVLDEGSSVDSPTVRGSSLPLLPSSGPVPKADSLHGERCP